MSSIVIATLYGFVRLENYQDLQQPLLQVLSQNQILGTLILASEGINGTVSGSPKALDALIAWLHQDQRLQALEYKFSYDMEIPFYRARVKLKKEIVTMGVDHIDPRKSAGTYVTPSAWNALISDPEVMVIDTRNDYESAIGTFKNAVLTNTQNFRDFPRYVQKHLDGQQHRPVAMFCTGGIRCEKSTAYLKALGFESVYHLKGGILKYLEEVPPTESLWQGECFVFDNRVSVDHALLKGSYDQCHACRLPITAVDKESQQYQPGVSCPACYNQKTDAERSRFKEREKQIHLAKKRGEHHLGTAARLSAKARKIQKIIRKTTQPTRLDE